MANAPHPVTVWWAGSPTEGRNALSLYRAADERLYARRLLRTPRPGPAGLTSTAPIDLDYQAAVGSVSSKTEPLEAAGR